MRGLAALAVMLFLIAPCARSATPASAPAPRLLVTPVELVDLAPSDQRYDQREDAARAAALGQKLRAALARSGRYRVVEQATAPPYRYTDCKACLADWARTQGADVALVTWVQKESRLIVMINMALIDLAHPDRPAAGGSIDLRGDSDEMWQAGAAQLLDRTTGVALTP
jgi:hypothetical protein